MDPKNPLFYVGTFVSEEAAGMLPVSNKDIGTVVTAMNAACYGPGPFQPGRCAALSQMVGRIRTQNQCLLGQPASADIAVTANAALSPATTLAATQLQKSTAHATVYSALAALGSTPQTPPCN